MDKYICIYIYIWVTLPKTGQKYHMESEKSNMGISFFVVATESWFYPVYVYVKHKLVR